MCVCAETGITEQIVNIYHAWKLSKNTENIYICCNSDRFVLEHDLQGLFSGMCISEVVEAAYCGLGLVSQELSSR